MVMTKSPSLSPRFVTLSHRECPIAVYILESVSPQDKFLGRTAVQILSSTPKLQNVPGYALDFVDARSFDGALWAWLKWHLAYHDNAALIFHIIAHGDRGGIRCTYGEPLRWNTLSERFVWIYDQIKSTSFAGWLILCMSSCDGAQAFQMALRDDQRPFAVLIGPEGELDWADAPVAYGSFYRLLSQAYRIPSAVIGMNWAIGKEQFKMYIGEQVQTMWQQHKLELLSAALKELIEAFSPRFQQEPPTTGSSSEGRS